MKLKFGKKAVKKLKRVGRTAGRITTTAGKVTRVGSKIATNVGSATRILGTVTGQPEIVAAGQSLYTTGKAGTAGGRARARTLHEVKMTPGHHG